MQRKRANYIAQSTLYNTQCIYYCILQFNNIGTLYYKGTLYNNINGIFIQTNVH